MITGDDYISLAAQLAAKRSAGEASYRSAVSRAYYGAFHLASSFLSELGFKVPKGANAHGWIPQALVGSGCDDAMDAGRLLQDLHAERITADYRWDNRATGNQRDAKTSVETADQVRSLLVASAAQGARGIVKAGVAEYLRKRGD
ncbi:MAG TPA: HEPN domain-containing protein [Pirellulales bacterium]|nr:HEPN domain-containing protein [Pirellulales bacterium]